MTIFTFQGHYDGVTRCGPGDDRKATAKHWALHIPGHSRPLLRVYRDSALESDQEVYEVVGGDSWRQWAEPLSGGPYDEPALHISFPADDETAAVERARTIWRALRWVHPGDRPGVLSTAGDWAEQHPDPIGGP